MSSAEFQQEYDLARAQTEQVDDVIYQLDELRVQLGLSTAELAWLLGKDPSALRRLFTAEVNPDLTTVVSLATALDAEVRIVPRQEAPEDETPSTA